MPSRRSRPRTERPRPVRVFAAFAGGIAALVLAACPSSGPPPKPAPSLGDALPVADRSFLPSPLEGAPGEPDPARDAALGEAYRLLAAVGDSAGAREGARALLAADATYHPAEVLVGQADYLAGDFAGVVTRIGLVAESEPRYTAALLLLGRSAERLGDLANAYAAYLSVSDASAVALERSRELETRAFEIVVARFEDAVAHGRLDDAERQLHQLRVWAPEHLDTIETGRRLAEVRGDRQAERLALEQLLGRDPSRRDLIERRAELDLADGDAARGLQALRELLAANPEDARLGEKVERAKFRWRVTLLPADVQRIAAKAELNRGDFSVLAYWLVPEIRYSRPGAGKIATDILDHPRREEIARVINLGLFDIDSTLHTFGPERGIDRGAALRALLRAAGSLGGRPCSGDLGAVCESAVTCGLVGGSSDCRVSERLSGDGALELLRRTQRILSRE